MFKKVFFILVSLFPLIFTLIVGIPVLSEGDYFARKERVSYKETSRRCFWVATYDEYIYCLKNNPKLSGLQLIESVLSKTNRLSPLFTVLFTLSFTANIALIVYLLIKRN